MKATVKGDQHVHVRVRPSVTDAPIMAAITSGREIDVLAVDQVGARKWAKIALTAGGTVPSNDDNLALPQYGYMAADLLQFEAVTPPPVTPPVITATHSLGYHVISYSRGAVDRANAGDKFVTIIDDEMTAAQVAQAHPDCTVLFRRWIGSNKFDGDKMANAVGGIKAPNVINLGYCEADSWGYGTPQELRDRMRHDLRFADLMLAQGKNVGVGSYSMGCPDYTQQWVIDQMKGYAPVCNRKTEMGMPKAYMDLHLYSPKANRIAPAMRAMAASDMPYWVLTGAVGNVKTYGDHPTTSKNTGMIATWQERYSGEQATYNPNPPATEMDVWFELRWQWLYTHCGLDPEWARIVCSETGLDEGGVGGFPAHNSTREQFDDWCRHWIATQSRPLTINGKQYASPFLGATIFQYGAGTNPSWMGYDAARYL